MATGSVLYEVSASNIATITLNRPRALNAINLPLLTEFVDALRKCQQCKVIIVQGAGDKAFCAGADLKESLNPETGSAQELRVAFEKLQAVTRLMSSSAALVIAVVEGFAVGGGAEFALSADFVIGGPSAKFRFPEVAIGYAATGAITQRLPTLVGLLKAKQLLLTGCLVDAEEALKIGLLSELTGNPKARAQQLAHSLADMPRVASSSSKLSLERATFPNQEAVLQDELHVASLVFAQYESGNAMARSNVSKKGKVAKQEQQLGVTNLNSALAAAVQKSPSATFLRFGGRDQTFAEFDSAVARLAGAVRGQGVGPGDRVVVMMNNSVEMVQTWFAVNRIGAIWAPVNPELKSATLQHVIQTAQSTFALIDPEFAETLQSCNVIEPGRVFPLGMLPAAEPVAASSAVPASNCTTSAFLFTSGTSGRSKPCILSHGYFLNSAQTLSKYLGFQTSDVLYTPFPLFHIDATALTVVPALLCPCVAAISSRYSASNFWNEIRATGATIYDFMGATLAFTYKQPPMPSDVDHKVRLAWGVPVPDWAKDYEKRFNHPIIELYGSCESGVPVIQQGPRIPGSCGKVVEGYSILVVDNHGNPVAVNTEGDLLVRADTPNAVFGGYFGDIPATADTFAGTWLHTGDRARIDQAGNLFYIGRVKDVIRRRGETVNAFEVEEEVFAHPEVSSIAAFAIPATTAQGTEDEVKIMVVPKQGARARGFTERSLWEWTIANLARFQVPNVVHFVDQIERTPTGKIEKWRLSKEGGVRFETRARRSSKL